MNSAKVLGLVALTAGSALADTDPSTRADSYHTEYSEVANAFRGLDFPSTEIATVPGTTLTVDSFVAPYKVSLTLTDVNGDEDVNMSVQVQNLPTDDVTGCQPLSSFYTEVRDKLVETLPYAIEQMESNTGDQQEIEGLRQDIEKAQKDVHNIEVFCGDLANMLRIRRNVYHAYTSAWGQIQFGDGTMPARRLRSSGITHQQVIKRALSQMEHEPEVVVKLLQ